MIWTLPSFPALEKWGIPLLRRNRYEIVKSFVGCSNKCISIYKTPKCTVYPKWNEAVLGLYIGTGLHKTNTSSQMTL